MESIITNSERRRRKKSVVQSVKASGETVQLKPFRRTFKVNVSVCVDVQLLQDLLQLPFLQLLPQQRLDCLLHFLLVDLSIAVEVKLQGVQAWEKWVNLNVRLNGRKTVGQPTDLHKGWLELLQPQHVSCLSHHSGSHQFNKVLKVHQTTHCDEKTGIYWIQPQCKTHTKETWYIKASYFSSWFAAQSPAAPFLWACSPWSSCILLRLCSSDIHLDRSQTPWRPLAALHRRSEVTRSVQLLLHVENHWYTQSVQTQTVIVFLDKTAQCDWTKAAWGQGV